MIEPYAHSRTDRAQWQRNIRNRLGTSREGAASTYSVLVAAAEMQHLVKYATAGALTLQLVTEAGEPVRWADAIRDAARNPAL